MTESRPIINSGLSDARAKPGMNDGSTLSPEDDRRRLVAIRHEKIDGTVTLLSWHGAISHVLRSRPWATLVRDVGWTLPARYLEHVEMLLDAADVDLFDVDGIPTPRRRLELAAAERDSSRVVLDEIRAKREWCEAHTPEIERARRSARASFAAVAAPVASDPTPDGQE